MILSHSLLTTQTYTPLIPLLTTRPLAPLFGLRSVAAAALLRLPLRPRLAQAPRQSRLPQPAQLRRPAAPLPKRQLPLSEAQFLFTGSVVALGTRARPPVQRGLANSVMLTCVYLAVSFTAERGG